MTQHIQLREVTICLEDYGQGSPVLLLHGFPATRFLWSRVAPQLVSAGFRTLIPDLVGYGDSVAPAGMRIDMASQARWLLELLDELRLAEVTVVAHDVGSAAAQLLVVNAPKRIQALAVLDGVHETEWAIDVISSIRDWDPANSARLFPVLMRRLGKSSAMREMLASYQGESGGLRLVRAARDLDPQQTANIGARLRASGIPALVLWGEADEFLSIENVGRPLAESLQAKLVPLPGGHFTPLDCPDDVTDALKRFLASDLL